MKRLLTLFIITALLACSADKAVNNDDPTPPAATNNFLVDSLATAKTVRLFENLQTLSPDAVLFGHQDATAYGIGWQGDADRSDVKSVVGDYPAVYGWDLGDIEQGSENLDGVTFDLMRQRIIEAYERGGVNTISMHLDNPVTGGSAWDNSPAVPGILPGAMHHEKYLQTLDAVADFLKSLKTDDGVLVPVIFRPYHEHNHTWSWWGSQSCTPEEYNQLWKMTVEYLRDSKEVHNLLYAISPQEISSESQYLQRYPGDEFVDVLGTDYYLLWDQAHVSDLGRSLDIIAGMAAERNKISALTEIGIDGVPINDWWTNYLLAALKYSEASQQTAWALVWRNDSKDHHFGPYPGHSSVTDFQKFYQSSLIYFESDLPELYD